MARLRGIDRLELARLVRELGEDGTAARLHIGRGTLARALAGLTISAGAGGRIARGLYLAGPAARDDGGDGDDGGGAAA
jgi:hypothetical protein